MKCWYCHRADMVLEPENKAFYQCPECKATENTSVVNEKDKRSNNAQKDTNNRNS